MKIILVVLTGLLLSTRLLAAQSNDLKISVTTTNANGYTEDTWTTKILDAQAKALLNFALDNTKQAFLNNGGKAKDWTPKHTYSSRFRILNKKKYAAIFYRFHFTYTANQEKGILDMSVAQVSTLRGTDFVSVTCGAKTAEAIDIYGGPCNEAIKNNLGVSMAF